MVMLTHSPTPTLSACSIVKFGCSSSANTKLSEERSNETAQKSAKMHLLLQLIKNASFSVYDKGYSQREQPYSLFFSLPIFNGVGFLVEGSVTV